MADNVAITPGTGATVAADDIGGVLHQRVKISQGADGSATDVSSAAPLQVTLANGSVPSHAVTNAGTFATQVTSIAAGDNNIGNVDVVTLPALAAGTNNIGDVDVLTLGGQTPAFGSGALSSSTLRTVLASDSPGIITTGTAGSASSVVLTIQGIASMVPVQAETAIQYIDVTLSTDTSAYASGDLIADAQIVAACTRANDVEALLQSIMVIDEDDQKAAFTIYFASASASWGSENSAPSISDANAREILGFVDVATGDYKDLGGVSVVSKNNVGIVCKPATGSDDIYVAVVNGSGTPTYTATGVKLRLGFI